MRRGWGVDAILVRVISECLSDNLTSESLKWGQQGESPRGSNCRGGGALDHLGLVDRGEEWMDVNAMCTAKF